MITIISAHREICTSNSDISVIKNSTVTIDFTAIFAQVQLVPNIKKPNLAF